MEFLHSVFLFLQTYPLRILKKYPNIFRIITHAKVGAPTVALRAIICRKSTLVGMPREGGGRGSRNDRRGNAGWSARNILDVCPRSTSTEPGIRSE